MRVDYEGPLGGHDHNTLRLIRKFSVRELVGELLTYVDATYQDKEQREAQKDIVRNIVYRWFDNSFFGQEVLDKVEALLEEMFPDPVPGAKNVKPKK